MKFRPSKELNPKDDQNVLRLSQMVAENPLNNTAHDNLPTFQWKYSYKVIIIIIIIIINIIIIIIMIIIMIIFSFITVFAGVLFVHQPSANHAPRVSVTQVNHSVHTLSTFLRIRADPSMQIF